MRYEIDSSISINETLKKLIDGDTLFLKKGIYKEKVRINTPNISIIGEDKNTTIIENMDYSPKIHEDHQEYITFRTWSVIVISDNVNISNITIKNASIPATKYGQAVALHVLGDNFKMDNSILLGDQDTLFCGPLPDDLALRYINFLCKEERQTKESRQLYTNTYIEGGVDFIFGSGNAVFKNCHFHAIEPNFGYFFAPSHNKDQKYGFTIIDSTFSGFPNTMYLARPWRDYGKVVIINSTILNDVLFAEGFSNWNDTKRYKTARFYEYNTKNINTHTFVNWSHHLTKDDIEEYSIENIFNLSKNKEV